MIPRRPVRWDRQLGAYRLTLSEDDRTVLRELAPQFISLLDEPEHPVVKRLFPPAYSDPRDEEHQQEFRRLMLEDLVQRHREEFELLARTAGADHLSEDELLAWTRAINSIRLVIGTFLDVTEEAEVTAPKSDEEAVYHWLSFLLQEAIEALDRQT